MFCRFCGNEMVDSSANCGKCGKRQERAGSGSKAALVILLLAGVTGAGWYVYQQRAGDTSFENSSVGPSSLTAGSVTSMALTPLPTPEATQTTVTRQTDYTRSLAAAYGFANNTQDTSGNQNNGTPVGIVGCKDRFGRDGQAGYFDGRTSYARIPPSNSMDLREGFTVSAWICPSTQTGEQTQIIWRGDERGAKDPYSLALHTNKIYFRIDSADQSFAVEVPHNSFGQFSMWTAVCDPSHSTMSLYRNSVLTAQRAAAFRLNYDTSTCWDIIGAVDNGVGQNYCGIIDEILLFSKPLSTAEVHDLFLKSTRSK